MQSIKSLLWVRQYNGIVLRLRRQTTSIRNRERRVEAARRRRSQTVFTLYHLLRQTTSPDMFEYELTVALRRAGLGSQEVEQLVATLIGLHERPNSARAVQTSVQTPLGENVE